MKTLFDLLRIKHWVKNVFILLPAFFGGVFSIDSLPHLFIGFIVFSFVSSCIYIINDLNDISADQLHPIKKTRPIPSGLISKQKAIGISGILFTVAFALSFYFLPTNFLYVLSAYFGLNIAYSFFLKHLPLIDLLIVSFGFVFRIIGGAELVSVELSFWLLLMTFLFSLFIVVAKRRDDFSIADVSPSQIRKVNRYYNLAFLNTILSTIASLLMVCYIMYTTNSIYFISRPYWALGSCVLVILGLIRYFQAIYVENEGGSPTDFALKDHYTRIIVCIWLAIFGYLIYL